MTEIIYLKLKKLYFTKKVLIWLVEVIMNVILIKYFDFEFNIIGLLTVVYLTTSLCIKKMDLRVKVL